MLRFNRGGREKGEMAGVERRREGKEKVEGMTEGRGGRKAWGIRMGGIAPLLLGGIDATGYGTNNANNSGYREQITKYLFTFATG